jgi:monoterpene epsilon-lactone hydrolase
MTNQDSGPEALYVPARTIPIPKSISPEAQAFLAAVPRFSEGPKPALDDVEGWRDLAERSDAMVIATAHMHKTRWPADTVTHQLPNAKLYEIIPDNADSAKDGRAILYLHGGGFFMGGGEAAIVSALSLAGASRCRTYSLDYRMGPLNPFPAALEDSLDAWQWLCERYKPANLAIFGGSAGGNLGAALPLKLREMGLPMPAACALHSPACDLTEVGDSHETNAGIDCVLVGRSPELMALYAGGHDYRDPLISPVFADYSQGFPPTILTTGTRDVLLSSTVLLHRAMRRGGVKAELHVWEAMSHAPFFGAPEESELYGELVRFMLEHMD